MWLGLGLPLFSQTPPSMIDFDRQVHPILAAKCLMCHSQEKTLWRPLAWDLFGHAGRWPQLERPSSLARAAIA